MQFCYQKPTIVLQSWVQVFHTFFTNSTLVWTNSTTTTTQNKCSCFQLIGPVIQNNFCIYRLSFLRWRQSIIFNWHCIYFGSEVVEVKWWTTIYHFVPFSTVLQPFPPKKRKQIWLPLNFVPTNDVLQRSERLLNLAN